MALLSSQIFQPGTKFKVSTDTKDNKYGPGTIGFMSYVEGPDREYRNVVGITTIIVRRGKGGKERLERAALATPLFDVKNKKLQENLPDKNRKCFVNIEPTQMPSTIMGLAKNPIDYLGWATAYAIYVQKLTKISNKLNLLKNYGNIQAMGNMTSAYNDELADEIKSQHTNSEAINNFVTDIRILEASLSKHTLFYMSKVVSEVELKAVRGMLKNEITISGVDMVKLHEAYSVKYNNLRYLLDKYGKKTLKKVMPNTINLF